MILKKLRGFKQSRLFWGGLLAATAGLFLFQNLDNLPLTGAGCSIPGQLNYANGTLQFCDGTQYISMKNQAAGTCSQAGALSASAKDMDFCDGSTLWSIVGPPVGSCSNNGTISWNGTIPLICLGGTQYSSSTPTYIINQIYFTLFGRSPTENEVSSLLGTFNISIVDYPDIMGVIGQGIQGNSTLQNASDSIWTLSKGVWSAQIVSCDSGLTLSMGYCINASWAQLPNTNPSAVFPDPSVLVPNGTSYPDSVPDTLDLADRAQYFIQGMTSTFMYDHNYAPPGSIQYYGSVPQMLVSPNGGNPNWGKSAQALVMARRMSGFDLNDSQGTLTLQYKSLTNMINPVIDTWGVVQPNPGGWPTPMSVALEALIDIYRQYPAPQLNQLINQMAAFHEQDPTPLDQNGESMLYYGNLNLSNLCDYSDNWTNPVGCYLDPFVQGKAMRALTTWFTVSGDQNALNAVGLLGNFMINYNNSFFWQPFGSISGGAGHFAGHIHGFLNAIMGILWQAEALQAQNPSAANGLIQFANQAYLFVRDLEGASTVGNFGEICQVGDMIRIAIKLADVGAADYYDDVDRWLRNELAEAQILYPNAIPNNSDGDPATGDLFDHIGQRVQGLFFEDAEHAFAIPTDPSTDGGYAFQSVACGFGNPMMGIYDAWDRIVQYKGSVAYVNLLMNRSSCYLDVKSELPYGGVVHVITKPSLGPVNAMAIRIPTWANLSQVQVALNGQDISGQWIWAGGNYVWINNPQPNANYQISFPIVIQTMTITQWKSQTEMWQESNPNNSSADPGEQFRISSYTGTFRGGTLVAVDDPPTSGVRLYQEPYRQTLASLPPTNQPAPYVTKNRFAPTGH